MSEPTGDELTILEIGSQKSSMHTLAVLDQVKQMTLLTGKGFDKEVIMKHLRDMYDRGLVDYLEKLDSWKITEDGRSYI